MRIELKKRCVRRSFQQAEEMAAQAHINLDNARKKLEQTKKLESEKSESISHSCQTVDNIVDKGKRTETQENESQNSNALKVARGICLFTLFPTFVFTLLSSSESIGDLRPHGVIASSMVLFGIIAPLLIFAHNSKLQKFALAYLTSKLKITVFKRSYQVEPILMAA